MSKQITRSFSYGMMFSLVVMTVFYYMDTQQVTKDTVSKSQSVSKISADYLKNNQLVAIPKKELERLEQLEHQWIQHQKSVITTNEKPNKDHNALVELIIHDRLSSEAITQLLQKKGVVKDAKALNRYLEQQGVTNRLQNGTYYFEKNSSFATIAAKLSRKPSRQ